MANNKKIIKVISMIMVLLVVTRINVFAESIVTYNENKKFLDEKMSVETSKKFIENDKKYLENKPNKLKVEKEQKELEKKLEEVKSDYELINNIKLYNGNVGLKNNALRTAIKNRENYIKESSNFKYDDKTIYNIDRGYKEEAGTNKYFTQEEMDLNYEATKEVLKNIELNTNFLNQTVFVISPFILEGIKGYTVSRKNRRSTIVISNHIFGAPKDWKTISTMSTVLHEIGHVFQNYNREKFENNMIAKEYIVESDRELKIGYKNGSKEAIEWKTSINENFAEDFRIYFSKKLGEKSFEPLAKKTFAEYDEYKFKKVITALTK